MMDMEVVSTPTDSGPRNRAVVSNPDSMGTRDHPRYYPNPGPPLEDLDTISLAEAMEPSRITRALPTFPMHFTPASRIPRSGAPADGAVTPPPPPNGFGLPVAVPELIVAVTPPPCPSLTGTGFGRAVFLHVHTSLWLYYTPYGGTSQQGLP